VLAALAAAVKRWWAVRPTIVEQKRQAWGRN